MESTPGVGSTFHFTVQVQACSDEPPEHLREDQPLLRGKYVLIVERSATVARIVTQLLTRWGMRVQHVTPAECEQIVLAAVQARNLPQLDTGEASNGSGRDASPPPPLPPMPDCVL